MKVSKLIELSGAKCLTGEFEDREIVCGYTCDLLSHVMGKGQADMAWITVQAISRSSNSPVRHFAPESAISSDTFIFLLLFSLFEIPI